MLRYIENSIGVTEFPFKLHFCARYKCTLQTQLINSDNQSAILFTKKRMSQAGKGKGNGDGGTISIDVILQKGYGLTTLQRDDIAAISNEPIQKVKAKLF